MMHKISSIVRQNNDSHQYLGNIGNHKGVVQRHKDTPVAYTLGATGFPESNMPYAQGAENFILSGGTARSGAPISAPPKAVRLTQNNANHSGKADSALLPGHLYPSPKGFSSLPPMYRDPKTGAIKQEKPALTLPWEGGARGSNSDKGLSPLGSGSAYKQKPHMADQWEGDSRGREIIRFRIQYDD